MVKGSQAVEQVLLCCCEARWLKRAGVEQYTLSDGITIADSDRLAFDPDDLVTTQRITN
jgi:hypothetical protein